jgi:hypothetical protein
MPRQGDPWHRDPLSGRVAIDRVVARGAELLGYQQDERSTSANPALLEVLLEKRLAHLGVESLRPDFFGQVAQFLHEVSVCTTVGEGRYVGNEVDYRYGQRLSAWWRDWSANIQNVGFDELQRRHMNRLAQLKDELSPELELSANEMIKLELWVRENPSDDHRELALWASSEHQWHVKGAKHRGEIEIGSEYVAVRTFCRGNVLLESLPSGTARRWQSFLAVPVLLTDEPWNRLPVGVVQLLSNQRDHTSCLRKLTRPRATEIASILRECAIELLDPAKSALTEDGQS